MLQSNPFSGRRIETPGTSDGDAEDSGDRGLLLYLVRLQDVQLGQNLSEPGVVIGTYAARQPSKLMDHRIKYQVIDTPAMIVLVVEVSSVGGLLSDAMVGGLREVGNARWESTPT